MKNKLFREPYEIKLSNLEKYPYLFPNISINILNKLRMTDIALYSLIISDSAEYLINLVGKLLLNYNIKLSNLIALELGCSIGGSLYWLLNNCKHIIGIEYEPLHVEICYHNLLLLNKKNMEKLALLYGDVEDIFMGKFINLNNTYSYKNNKYNKVTDNNILYNIDLIYIGTPFIDLKYGKTKVEHLIIKLLLLYNPIIYIIQLPCTISNQIHDDFYSTQLYKLLNNMSKQYDISIVGDLKQNNKYSNLHLIFIKKIKNKIQQCNNNILYIKNELKLNGIIKNLSKKFNINNYSQKYNILNIWRNIYAESYYINCIYKNNKIIFNTIIRNKNNKIKKHSFNIDYDLSKLLIKNTIENEINCKVMYNRFENIIKNVILM